MKTNEKYGVVERSEKFIIYKMVVSNYYYLDTIFYSLRSIRKKI
jgi:hypothetical protein